METLLNFLGTILSTLFPLFFSKKTDSEYLKKYKELRFNVAEALAKYGHCYKISHEWNEFGNYNLPQEYQEGQECFCSLGAKFQAIAETLPENCKDIPISKEQIKMISTCLRTLEACISIPKDIQEEQTIQTITVRAETNIREYLSLK